MSQRPRVLQFCAVDFTVRQFIAPLATCLESEGFEVSCACTRGPLWDELCAMGLRMVDIPMARSANPVLGLRTVWRLWRHLRATRPDILHVHTPVASMVGRLAGFLAGVPLIVYTAHGFYFHEHMPPVRRRVHILLEQLFGRLNDALFCVSREDARDAVRLGIARRERTYFIANGASSQRFDPGPASAEWRVAAREEFSIPAGATVITLMGRLVREKGTLEFMRVAARLAEEFRNLHFLVVGDTVTSEHDDAKTHILELARDPRLAGRVHFTGLRRDIPRLLAASDIFALPSWREGMPVSILEAMMMGLPVVATRIRGCREEVVDGETGFLVRPRDEEELHGALRHLVLHPERAMALGAAGRARALRHFDEAVILQRQVALYRRLLRRRHGAGGGGAR